MSTHTAGTATTRLPQPSASSATIQEIREQIISNARMLYADVFRKYRNQGPVRREDFFDIVIIRKPNAQGILAVLVYGKPESRKPALQGEGEKRSLFDAYEALLLASATKLGAKTKTTRDGGKENFFD